ncbi:RecX family transcriptional regulator, partial [Micromonospora sp. NPDC005313]
MAGRRARTGRGWDASPSRTGDATGTPRPRRGRRDRAAEPDAG